MKSQGPSVLGGGRSGQIKETHLSLFNPPASSIFVYKISLNVNGKYYPVKDAIVDSGASSCFIDVFLVKQLGLKTRKKEFPTEVELVDGRTLLSGIIDAETCPIVMRVDNHEEEISFSLISAPKHSVILGMTWLEKHNPGINWKTGKISFSCHCPAKQTPVKTVSKNITAPPVKLHSRSRPPVSFPEVQSVPAYSSSKKQPVLLSPGTNLDYSATNPDPCLVPVPAFCPASAPSKSVSAVCHAPVLAPTPMIPELASNFVPLISEPAPINPVCVPITAAFDPATSVLPV